MNLNPQAVGILNFQKKVNPYPFVAIPAGNFSTIIVKLLILSEYQISFH